MPIFKTFLMPLYFYSIKTTFFSNSSNFYFIKTIFIITWFLLSISCAALFSTSCNFLANSSLNKINKGCKKDKIFKKKILILNQQYQMKDFSIKPKNILTISLKIFEFGIWKLDIFSSFSVEEWYLPLPRGKIIDWGTRGFHPVILW